LRKSRSCENTAKSASLSTSLLSTFGPPDAPLPPADRFVQIPDAKCPERILSDAGIPLTEAVRQSSGPELRRRGTKPFDRLPFEGLSGPSGPVVGRPRAKSQEHKEFQKAPAPCAPCLRECPFPVHWFKFGHHGVETLTRRKRLPVNGAASVTVTGRRPVPVSEIVQPEPFFGTVTAPPTLSAMSSHAERFDEA
jgi:hypothetical protein